MVWGPIVVGTWFMGQTWSSGSAWVWGLLFLRAPLILGHVIDSPALLGGLVWIRTWGLLLLLAPGAPVGSKVCVRLISLEIVIAVIPVWRLVRGLLVRLRSCANTKPK